MDDADAATPDLGSRLDVCRHGGKWAAATVAQVDGPPPLPVRLQYPDGSMEWARFVSGSVMLAWRTPQGGKRSASAAAAPAHAATEVQAFVVLAEDASLRGRLSKARKQARSTALAAAKEFAEEQGTQQQRGGSAPGSPTKRRRLGKQPRSAKQGVDDVDGGSVKEGGQQQQQQQHAKRGASVADGVPPPSGLGGSPCGAANGELSAASSGQNQQLQAAAALERQRSRSTAAAGAGGPPQQQPKQQAAPGLAASDPGMQQKAALALEPVSQQEEEVVPSEALPCEPGSPQLAVPAAAGEAGAAASAVPAQRPAVTSLGNDSLTALAPLAAAQPSNGLSGNSPRLAPKSKPTSGKAGVAPGAAQKRQQQQQQVEQHGPRQEPLGVDPPGRGAGSPQPPATAEQQDAEDGEGVAAASPPERPGEAACRRFAALLPGLSFLKESITAAAAAAIAAGKEGAGKEVVRCVVDHMERHAAPGHRLPFFYLLDAVLAHSRKHDAGECGPDSIVGTTFPRTVGAALGRLVDLLGAHLNDAQKMERTLVNTWSAQPKRGLQPSLVQHALQKLRERIARHQSAWSDGDGAAAGAAGGSRQRAGSAGPLSEPALRQLLQRVGLQDVPVLAYVNIKDGSKVTLTRKWQVRDAWPDYSQLPLPIGAELEQHEAILAAGGAAAGQGPPAAEPSSPWHSTFNLGDWADDPWAIEQARLAAAAAERQRYEAAVAAQRAAAMAHAQHAAQHAAQQQRVQSTAAAAEADDFDMSLFKEATGGVLAAPLGQAALLPDLLQPLGELPWGGTAQPPLPAQPPPPGSGGAPPLPCTWPDDDDEEMGPPPLPPHSPPRDEYEMDMEEDEGTPPLPPPDDGGTPATAARSPPPAPAPPLTASRQQPQQQVAPVGSFPASWAAGAAPVGAPGFPPATADPRDLAAGAGAFRAPPGTPWPAHQQQQHAAPALLPPGLGVAPPAGMAAPPQMQQAAYPVDLRQTASIQHQQQSLAAQQQAYRLNMQAMAAQHAAAVGGMMFPPGFPALQAQQAQQAQQATLAFSPGMPQLARAPPTLPTPGGMPMRPQASQPLAKQMVSTPGQQPPGG